MRSRHVASSPSAYREAIGQQQHLWDELAVDVDRLLVVDGVGDVEAESERHVQDTENDGHLHLERVGKDEEIVGAVPCWIKSEWIDTAQRNGLQRRVRRLICRPLPA